MKKLLLTLSLILSVFALSAQSYVIKEKETLNVVTSGVTYYIYGDGSSSWGYPGGPLQVEFYVIAQEDVVLICEKLENDVVPGTTNDFCFGACFMPTVYVSPATPISANDTLDFSAHFTADDYLSVLEQEQNMTYYIYEEGDPDNAIVINVIFKYTLDDVESISAIDEFSNGYPMPASDVVNFDYSFNADVNAEIAVYNMMGQEVMRNAISGMSGKACLNVSDLTDGIYFYSLIVNGKTEKSSKLVIRK